MILDPFTLFLLLIFGHMIADYPLQGEFLAKAKNHRSPIPGISWTDALAAHAIIHGGVVGIITGSIVLGVAESIIHAIIDYTKCEGKIGFRTDQMLHIACKGVWIVLLLFGVV
jgi:hypothetical protein